MNNLRDVEYGDMDQIRQWRNLPEVSEHMYTDHYISESEHSRWFHRMLEDDTSRYWVIQSDGSDVGLANIYDLDEANKRCYWAFYIASPGFRGKGVGSYVEYAILTHVFDELHLNKLCCEVLGFNDAVTRMHERYGFSREGLLREHVFKNGAFVDIISLAMLRQEWNLRKPQIVTYLKSKKII